jgi:glycogen(starch) synthase
MAPHRRPTRILMTTDTVGGVWTYTLELAGALGLAGIHVGLASMGARPSAAQRREVRAVKTIELFESEFRLPWMEEPWADVEGGGAWLMDVASRYSPDLIHLNEPVYASLPWPVPTLAVAHSCVLSWWEAVWGEPASDEWSTYRERMRDGLAAADAVVAPSAWMLQQLRRHYGVPGGRAIPNGREHTAFSPQQKGAVIFAAGRVWDRAKNLLALAPVARELDWPVYLAGEARHPVNGQVVEADQLHLLGRLSACEVAAWLRRASIYAFPARYEPFGLSVLEAALAGCALVLSDLPSFREQWSGRALFVDPNRPAMLRDGIQSLIDDPLLRHSLGREARRHGLTITPRRMALAYLGVYSELMGREERSWKEPACAS